MTREMIDACKKQMAINNVTYTYIDINTLVDYGYKGVLQLPFSIRILLESALRQFDGKKITIEHIESLANWHSAPETDEVPFMPSRVLLQDFTGVPAVVDLAAMREAVGRAGLAPATINPVIPVDLVIDHSVMVDAYGSPEALAINEKKEFERNQERYKFLKWAGHTFDNFRVIPPGTGIIHQVNLEYLASVASTKEVDDVQWLHPDSLVGTDSHTTMINGLGVLGWGVGGIEAEAAMLGQPIYMTRPEVIGMELSGQLPEGSTATDLALRVTELLRAENVVGKFVEYFGDGVATMHLADRATVANMSPEYGATMGYFPVDEQTLAYLQLTGRTKAHIALVESYLKAAALYNNADDSKPVYTKVVQFDLGSVVPSLAGPKRPQDRVALTDMSKAFEEVCKKALKDGGFGLTEDDYKVTGKVHHQGSEEVITNGSVVLAAITSCTNTSNPSVMIGAGLVAKKAVELGLVVPKYVKTSLTPGSQVVTDYLTTSGVLPYLEELGFNIAGYGCATCIGNSGPLPEAVGHVIDKKKLTVASVLSGNRNFEGRIHAKIKANYLASPMLVVAYALAGTVQLDISKEPIGVNKNHKPVYLKDIWPTTEEINLALSTSIRSEDFVKRYANVSEANVLFNKIDAPVGELYQWDKVSTYIQEPSFFDNIGEAPGPITDVVNARVLANLGDSVTTDHISPAGVIGSRSPAGIYLETNGIEPEQFNSYGSRRGNHEVMMRGTFANIRIRNKLVEGIEGGMTKVLPEEEIMPIFDASMAYQEESTPLVVLAGKEYGTGSSRDWAAKGTWLLGVKAVIAESYERIHRSNLVGMGVLPLQFEEGMNPDGLELDGTEIYTISGLSDKVQPGQNIRVQAEDSKGAIKSFQVKLRLDSDTEIEYYQNGGILHYLVRQLIV